jgi:hypothetical protein
MIVVEQSSVQSRLSEHCVAWSFEAGQQTPISKEQLRMQRLKLLGLALMAVFALGAFASAAASAEELPNFLPEGTEANPVTFKDHSKGGTLETKAGKKVTCTEDHSEGQATSKKLGSFDVLFLGCKSEGTPCLGLGDKVAESVLVLGTFHIRRLLTEAKHVYIVFLLEHVHFTCGFGLVLILVLGCVAALVLQVNKLVKEFEIHFEQEKGVQKPTEIADEKNEKNEKCILETKVGNEAYVQSGELTLATVLGFEQGGKAVEALIMA